MLNFLYIDDDAADREIYKNLIVRGFDGQCNVELAATWKEGLQKILATPFDCIVLDLLLPEKTGIEGLQEMHNRFIDIPCIIITGTEWVNHHVEVFKKGAIDFLNKQDVTQVTLAKSISNAIEKHKLIKALTESNRIMERLIDILSHDLKNPLESIIRTANYLLDKNSGNVFTKFQEEKIKKIEETGEFLNRLIEIILHASTLYKGDLAIHKEKLNVSHILDYCINLFTPKAIDKKIALIKDNPWDELMIHADKDMMIQILNNLIDNALSYTEKGYVKVLIEVQYGKLICRVQDTGVGMTKDELARLFIPFKQVSDVVSGRGPSLGLSIVKSIINLHQGTISVKSQVGEGSEFTFILPLE